MFKNSLNCKGGIIKNVDLKDVKFGITYYDSMYRKTICIAYENEELRNLDFKKAKDSENGFYVTYKKLN